VISARESRDTNADKGGRSSEEVGDSLFRAESAATDRHVIHDPALEPTPFVVYALVVALPSAT